MRLATPLLLCLLLGCVSAKRKDRSAAQADLGSAYLREGSTESAITTFREAVRLDPGNWKAWNHLGLALGIKGRIEDAEKAFKKAVRLADGQAEAHLNYGVLLYQVERWEEAVAQYELALEDVTYRKPALILNDMGLALHAQGLDERAVEVYKEAIRRAPHLCQARFNLGLAERDRGHPTEALDAFEQVITICKEDAPGAYFQAGMILLGQDQREKGAEYLRLVIELAPTAEAADEARRTLVAEGLM